MLHQSSPAVPFLLNGVLTTAGAIGFGVNPAVATFAGIFCSGFTSMIYYEINNPLESRTMMKKC